MKWRTWLNSLDAEVKIKATQKSFNSIKPWTVLKNTLKRDDNLFFEVNGFAIEIVIEGVKKAWNQILLKTEDPIHGWLILAVAEEDEQYYLLSARAEAGWKSLGLGPTFQASKSNLLKNPELPRREMADDEAYLILQDGGIYFDKRNYAGVKVFQSRAEFEERFGINENERWFNEDEFFEALNAGKVSEHLLQAKACYKK